MSVEIFSRLEGEYVPPTALPEGYTCRQLRFPNTPFWRTTIYELISRLGFVENWQETPGRIAPHQAANIGAKMFDDFFKSRCEVIGEIKYHALKTLPDNWLACDGTIYQRTAYPELYDALPSQLIVSTTQFRTPNLEQRFALGTKGAPTSFGTQAGERDHTLNETEMPAHTHPAATANYHFVTYAPDFTGFKPNQTPQGPFGIQPNGGTTTGSRGGGQAHNNMPPYYAVFVAIVAR